MYLRIALVLTSLFFFTECSKEEALYTPIEKEDPYKLYKEALEAFEKRDFFYASKKFSEAELRSQEVKLAAKSSIMASFSLYGINFYQQALDNLNRYLKTYPSDKNIQYAHYLIAIIYFEQIEDEKKDTEPLIKARNQINFYLKNFPNSVYAVDLNFKKDLIQNQLAAKELYVARYYISVQKWVPAIKRLKNIVENYEKTIFVEEALHRLVEIYYRIGLIEESENYAKILGYNYNSSEWFEKSYKIFNKDYQTKKNKMKVIKKIEENKNYWKKIIEKIKN